MQSWVLTWTVNATVTTLNGLHSGHPLDRDGDKVGEDRRATIEISGRMSNASKQGRREQQEAQRAKKVAAGMVASVRTEFVLIRHGETDWNRERRLQGQDKPGPPLNALGFQQTAVLSRVLLQRYSHFDAVFSSDLLRTVQTAQALAAPYGAQVHEHPGLRERHMGVLQGLTYAEAPAQQPLAWVALQSDSSSTRIPGGESLIDLQERITATLLEIASWYPGKRVLVVSHGGALHAVHRAARGFEAKGKVMNCSISVLLAEPVQLTPKQQQRVMLGRQLSALHEAVDVQRCWHGRQPCHHCGDGVCCCAGGSRSSSSSSLCKEDATAVVVSAEVESSDGAVSDSSECGCGLSMGCGVSENCFRSVSAGCEYKQAVDGSTGAERGASERVITGKLALTSFNDAVAAYELAAEGVAMHGGGFGGSAREA